MFDEKAIIQKLASSICQRIARRTISALQRLTDCRLSGDDSGLENVWDEVCVQMQHEKSFHWWAYEETIRSHVLSYVEDLEDYERWAVWLQTEAGWDWSYEAEEEREKDVYVDPHGIVDYIVGQFVYAKAEKWSNTKIREYLEPYL